jgi:poly(hydroxyalkanoate) granule-associated protein
MATKTNKAGKDDPFADTVKESAQQIWLAGLGAFSKAQEQGGKVFEALVKEGLEMQRKTQSTAGEKFSEASSRMSSMASEFTSKASGHWDKLESIFEERVSRALNHLGVPSAREVNTLMARIEELERKVDKLGAARKSNATTRPGSAPRTAAKAVRRTARKSA